MCCYTWVGVWRGRERWKGKKKINPTLKQKSKQQNPDSLHDQKQTVTCQLHIDDKANEKLHAPLGGTSSFF